MNSKHSYISIFFKFEIFIKNEFKGIEKNFKKYFGVDYNVANTNKCIAKTLKRNVSNLNVCFLLIFSDFSKIFLFEK